MQWNLSPPRATKDQLPRPRPRKGHQANCTHICKTLTPEKIGRTTVPYFLKKFWTWKAAASSSLSFHLMRLKTETSWLTLTPRRRRRLSLLIHCQVGSLLLVGVGLGLYVYLLFSFVSPLSLSFVPTVCVNFLRSSFPRVSLSLSLPHNSRRQFLPPFPQKLENTTGGQRKEIHLTQTIRKQLLISDAEGNHDLVLEYVHVNTFMSKNLGNLWPKVESGRGIGKT